MMVQPRKRFAKCQWTHVRLSPLCYLPNLFTLNRCFILRGDKNIFLAWIFFNAHNKGIASKSVDKIGREHLTGQSFCNAHTALVWLYLTFILLGQKILLLAEMSVTKKTFSWAAGRIKLFLSIQLNFLNKFYT